jgi:hypothetical protein
MNRFLLSAAVAAVGLTTLSVPQTQAAEHFGRGSSHSSSRVSHGSRSEHQFHARRGFDYGRHGYRSFSWTHSYWSSYYGCYCYYAPSYGWCFYEPSYSCYLPVSYYSQVYPEFVPSGPAPVIAPPTVVQQTKVIVGSSSVPAPVPVPPPAPVPTTVQQTKVVVPAVPPTDAPPAPPGPPPVPQPKVAAGAP